MGRNYYDILGVSKDVSDADLKKAYKKLALKFHPDRVQESDKAKAAEKFKEVSEAYEVLSDKEKKQIYDQFGEEGLKGGMPNGGAGGFSGVNGFPGGAGGFQFRASNPEDVFRQFFGGADPFADAFSGGSGSANSRHRSSFSSGFPGGPGGLHSLFGNGFGGGGFPGAGPSQPPPIEQQLSCSLEELYAGTTKRMRIQRSTPSGPDTETLKVDVLPGWKAGTRVTFEQKGDANPGSIPADIVFVIQERPHPVFKREGNDLTMTHQLPLVDALCGHTITVRTLDGRLLPVTVSGVASPSVVKVVRGEGMPLSKSPRTKGDLRISFDVQFPKNLTDAQKQGLRQLLAPG